MVPLLRYGQNRQSVNQSLYARAPLLAELTLKPLTELRINMVISGILKVSDDVHAILVAIGHEGVDSEAHDRMGTAKCLGDCRRWASITGRADREDDQLGDLCRMGPWNVRV